MTDMHAFEQFAEQMTAGFEYCGRRYQRGGLFHVPVFVTTNDPLDALRLERCPVNPLICTNPEPEYGAWFAELATHRWGIGKDIEPGDFLACVDALEAVFKRSFGDITTKGGPHEANILSLFAATLEFFGLHHQVFVDFDGIMTLIGPMILAISTLATRGKDKRDALSPDSDDFHAMTRGLVKLATVGAIVERGKNVVLAVNKLMTAVDTRRVDPNPAHPPLWDFLDSLGTSNDPRPVTRADIAIDMARQMLQENMCIQGDHVFKPDGHGVVVTFKCVGTVEEVVRRFTDLGTPSGLGAFRMLANTFGDPSLHVSKLIKEHAHKILDRVPSRRLCVSVGGGMIDLETIQVYLSDERKPEARMLQAQHEYSKRVMKNAVAVQLERATEIWRAYMDKLAEVQDIEAAMEARAFVAGGQGGGDGDADADALAVARSDLEGAKSAMLQANARLETLMGTKRFVEGFLLTREEASERVCNKAIELPMPYEALTWLIYVYVDWNGEREDPTTARLSSRRLWDMVPYFMSLFHTQNFTDKEIHFTLQVLGRLPFPPKQYDNKQFMVYLQGVAGCGKTTLLKALSMFVDERYIARFPDSTQETFGMSSVMGRDGDMPQPKYMCVIPELSANHAKQIPVGTMLQLCEGEAIDVNRKHKGVVTADPLHVVAAGNGDWPYRNRGDNFYRRLVIIPFTEGGLDQKGRAVPNLFEDHIEKEEQLIVLVLLAFSYRTWAWATRDSVLSKSIPPKFEKARTTFQTDNNPVLKYLRVAEERGLLVKDVTAIVSLADFVEQFKIVNVAPVKFYNTLRDADKDTMEDFWAAVRHLCGKQAVKTTTSTPHTRLAGMANGEYVMGLKFCNDGANVVQVGAAPVMDGFQSFQPFST